MKKYALVRVCDRNCPIHYEGIKNSFVCENKELTIGERLQGVNTERCLLCRYGDTKEQLIKKIVQVMLRRFKRVYKGKFITVEMAEKQYLEVAKEIVEFLGVKE